MKRYLIVPLFLLLILFLYNVQGAFYRDGILQTSPATWPVVGFPNWVSWSANSTNANSAGKLTTAASNDLYKAAWGQGSNAAVSWVVSQNFYNSTASNSLWLAMSNGAYQIVQRQGFTGTMARWYYSTLNGTDSVVVTKNGTNGQFLFAP